MTLNKTEKARFQLLRAAREHGAKHADNYIRDHGLDIVAYRREFRDAARTFVRTRRAQLRRVPASQRTKSEEAELRLSQKDIERTL